MQSATYGCIPTANPTFLWLRRFGRRWIPGREVAVAVVDLRYGRSRLQRRH